MPAVVMTFYSYKGGTGRSMGLANTAWILASNGLRVLVVDWDLEAPGLHRYFHPFLGDKDLRSSPGVIDMMWEYVMAAMDPAGSAAEGWHESFADISPYAMSLDHEFPGGGRVDIVPAGRQDASYAALVSTFDWGNFYDRLDGGAFIDAVGRSMRDRYDYVLVDSRTGLSDTAGICTVQLPDLLVNCFTLSTQAIDGAASVAASVHQQRRDGQVRIFPVVMRVEDGEQDRLDASRDYARARLGPFLSHLGDPERYWGEAEVPYKSLYAYEEILATVGDRPRQENTVLAACERLVAHLTDGRVTELADPPSEAERRRLLARFSRQADRTAPRAGSAGPHAPRVFISWAYDSAEHFAAVRLLWFRLRESGVDARLDPAPGQRFADPPRWLTKLGADDFILVVASPGHRRVPGTPSADGWAQAVVLPPVLLPGRSAADIPEHLDGAAALTVDPSAPGGLDPLLDLLRRDTPALPADRPLRFTSACPVCGHALGETDVPVDPDSGRFLSPPSFRLEVGGPDLTGALPWRVTCLAGNYPPAETVEPRFSRHDVAYRYLLCGDGHIFPEATPGESFDINLVAAVGAPAGGKSTLLIRTLQQSVDERFRWTADDDLVRLRLRSLSPLEERPLEARVGQWNALRLTGDTADATRTGDDLPSVILDDVLGETLEAVRYLITRIVVDGQRRAERWGRGLPQPLVLRSEADGRQTWTGVLDLPGELFGNRGAARREALSLRSFDALIWVVDPVVADSATEWLSVGSLMFDGSLRPGTAGTAQAAGTELDAVRASRELIQADIGRQLTMIDGPFASAPDQALSTLVAITKCDLVRAALTNSDLTLHHFGRPGAVARGIASYLAFAADRWRRGSALADEVAAALLTHLTDPGIFKVESLEQRVMRVAAALIDHFSRDGELWKLVHTGDEIRLRTDDGSPISIYVPSIDEHLTAALKPGAADQILQRDLIMSAIGCGLAYGLGLEPVVLRLQREASIRLRFFLCSPLTTVPEAVDGARLRPATAGERFPRVDERSAGLTQLQLAVLEGARR